MKLPARPNPRGFDLLFIAALALSLVLAACNNGNGPAY